MLEIVTRGPHAHELRRDGVRVAVVDDIADARKLAAVDELVEALRPFAEALNYQGIGDDEYDFDWASVVGRLTPSMFYDAQAAVARTKSK